MSGTRRETVRIEMHIYIHLVASRGRPIHIYDYYILYIRICDYGRLRELMICIS